MNASSIAAARRALLLLDLTDLSDTCTEAQIERLCAQAKTPHGPVAAVCIWPQHVKLARQRLAGTTVRVATVINFPAGDDPLNRVIADVEEILTDGAQDIDLVMPYKAFLAGDTQAPAEMIASVNEMLDDTHQLKVILETGAYPDMAAVARASRFAIDNGADFIKTSTGKMTPAATPEAARTMLTAIRDSGMNVGFKPAGGIRTLDDATLYLALADDIMGAGWATPQTFRFGASGLFDVLLAIIEGGEPGARKADY